MELFYLSRCVPSAYHSIKYDTRSTQTAPPQTPLHPELHRAKCWKCACTSTPLPHAFVCVLSDKRGPPRTQPRGDNIMLNRLTNASQSSKRKCGTKVRDERAPRCHGMATHATNVAVWRGRGGGWAGLVAVGEQVELMWRNVDGGVTVFDRNNRCTYALITPLSEICSSMHKQQQQQWHARDEELSCFVHGLCVMQFVRSYSGIMRLCACMCVVYIMLAEV